MSEHPLSGHPAVNTDPEVCAAYAADASGLSNVPDAVARPGSEEEVADLLRRCSSHGIPVTPQGLRSSTTGASVPREGIVLSLEKLSRVVELDIGQRFAVAQPGVVTSEFKKRARDAGLFYPPDPTSEEECTLGGTVACNASGSRTYRYGDTRRYVRRLRVVLADGTVTEVRRTGANKNSAGYFGLQSVTDLWIGSEGTLGVITEIEVDLLPAPPGFFSAMAFFPDWRRAVQFVIESDQARRDGRLSPRCLELFDAGSLDLIRPASGGLRIPEGAGAAVYFEEETASEEAFGLMERWYAAIETGGGLAEATIAAENEAEQADLRRLRHALPAGMNERGSAAGRDGGCKVSTDFAVPLGKLPEMMEESYAVIAERFGGFCVAYGHAGNGHPHFNMLARNPDEAERARDAAMVMCERAMQFGGTLAAEHGLGKLKVPYYRRLYPEWLYEAMRAVKTSLDPKGILSPGNLFD